MRWNSSKVRIGHLKRTVVPSREGNANRYCHGRWYKAFFDAHAPARETRAPPKYSHTYETRERPSLSLLSREALSRRIERQVDGYDAPGARRLCKGAGALEGASSGADRRVATRRATAAAPAAAPQPAPRAARKSQPAAQARERGVPFRKHGVVSPPLARSGTEDSRCRAQDKPAARRQPLKAARSNVEAVAAPAQRRLEAELHETLETLDVVEAERDFYFDKLRQVERILQQHRADADPAVLSRSIFGVLYAKREADSEADAPPAPP